MVQQRHLNSGRSNGIEGCRVKIKVLEVQNQLPLDGHYSKIQKPKRLCKNINADMDARNKQGIV